MFNVTSANPSNNLSNAFAISPVKVAFYPSRNRSSFGQKKVQIVLVWLEKMTCFMLKKYGDNRRSFSPMPIAHVSQLSLLYIKQSRAISILLSFILSGIFFRASSMIL